MRVSPRWLRVGNLQRSLDSTTEGRWHAPAAHDLPARAQYRWASSDIGDESEHPCSSSPTTTAFDRYDPGLRLRAVAIGVPDVTAACQHCAAPAAPSTREAGPVKAARP